MAQTRPYKPANMPGMIAYLTVIDAEKTIEFYKNAFGFQLADEPMVYEGKIMHAEMTFMDTRIMFTSEDSFGTKARAPRDAADTFPLHLYFYCEDVDAIYRQAIANGAVSVREPKDEFWGDRMCQVRDINGYTFGFACNVADFDASKMEMDF